MIVTLEATNWTVRWGDKHLQFGDEFDSICQVVKTGPKSVRLFGAVGKMPLRVFYSLKKQMKDLGFETYTFERYEDGVITIAVGQL